MSHLFKSKRVCYGHLHTGHPPQSVNSTLWNDPNNLGLRLYIPVPREPDTEADALSATLQLFLKPNPRKFLRFSFTFVVFNLTKPTLSLTVVNNLLKVIYLLYNT